MFVIIMIVDLLHILTSYTIGAYHYSSMRGMGVGMRWGGKNSVWVSAASLLCWEN